jgi:hypothetical protein
MSKDPVESAIRARVRPGQTLSTPVRSKEFEVGRVDSEGLVLLLGKGRWWTRLSWECLEGIIPYLREHGGAVVIGGQHTTTPTPGTLDAYLKQCVKRTTANWVAVVLELAGIAEVVRTRPISIRLKPDGRA